MKWKETQASHSAAFSKSAYNQQGSKTCRTHTKGGVCETFWNDVPGHTDVSHGSQKLLLAAYEFGDSGLNNFAEPAP